MSKITIVGGTMKISTGGQLTLNAFEGDINFTTNGHNTWIAEEGHTLGKYETLELPELPKNKTTDTNGCFYKNDGKFLGKIGESQQVYTVDEIDLENRKATNKKSLNINHSKFIKLAAIAYAESSVGNGVEIKEEVYAIANAMNNFKKITGKDSVAYAAIDGNTLFDLFIKKKDLERNGTFMQEAIYGVINALSDGIDYSFGGTHWAGNDIGSKKEKWVEGMHFTKDEHDLFKLGNNKKPGKEYWLDKNKKETKLRGKYNYKWETTKAYGGKTKNGKTTGTTFVKVTDDFKNATGNKGQ